jgi:protease-4
MPNKTMRIMNNMNIWLIDQPYFEQAYLAKMARKHEYAIESQEGGDKRREYFKQFNRLREPMSIDENGVATIEVVGPLVLGAVPIEKLLGVSDYSEIQAELMDAMENDKIKAVVISVDSGGGMVLGVPETADLVVELAKKKPVVAHTSTIMASAAYYLSAGATAVTSSKSAIVGSIGTVAQVVDITGFLEKMGVKVHTITPDQSDLKTTGYEDTPLTDAQRQNLKDSVTETNEEFMAFVQSNRPLVEKSTMRGQTFSGKEAEKLGLVDGVGTLEEAKRLALEIAR